MKYVFTGGAGSRVSHPLDKVCNVKVVDNLVFRKEVVHPILESRAL